MISGIIKIEASSASADYTCRDLGYRISQKPNPIIALFYIVLWKIYKNYCVKFSIRANSPSGRITRNHSIAQITRNHSGAHLAAKTLLASDNSASFIMSKLFTALKCRLSASQWVRRTTFFSSVHIKWLQD